jgi:NDP-sugar pyrophosphorylase family protein
MPLTLVVMAAGLGTRFGGPKQLIAVGPAGEVLLDYAVFDAARAGFDRVVLVIRPEVDAPLRAHARAWFPRVATAFVEQRLDALPGGALPPPGRAKPWGTGQAVLAAGPALDGPFAVCNADDFYGAGAFRALARHLASPNDAHALAGYRLDETLSEHGGVARAVCETDPGGALRRIVEVTDLRRSNGAVVGRVAGRGERSFTGAEVVSMNLWGFRPAILAALAEQFAGFQARHGQEPDAEFLLATAVNDQVAAGRARLQVVSAPDRWFGLTFAADLAAARTAVAALVRDGAYPDDLRAGFARL